MAKKTYKGFNMLRTKWICALSLALLGCVNALMDGQKVLNVRRVRRRRLVSPSRDGDGSVIAAIVVGKKNHTKFLVPSLSLDSREKQGKAELPKRDARLFR